VYSASELPDGIFSNQNSQFGYILEGLGMKNVCIFSGHLVYFMAIWNIFGQLEAFFLFWYAVPRKIWQPSSSHTHRGHHILGPGDARVKLVAISHKVIKLKFVQNNFFLSRILSSEQNVSLKIDLKLVWHTQGDQIGRVFVQWVTVYLHRAVFEN
jgi:hypothetical protein